MSETNLLELFGIHHHKLAGWYFYKRPRYSDRVYFSAEHPETNRILTEKSLKELFRHVREGCFKHQMIYLPHRAILACAVCGWEGTIEHFPDDAEAARAEYLAHIEKETEDG